MEIEVEIKPLILPIDSHSKFKTIETLTSVRSRRESRNAYVNASTISSTRLLLLLVGFPLMIASTYADNIDPTSTLAGVHTAMGVEDKTDHHTHERMPSISKENDSIYIPGMPGLSMEAVLPVPEDTTEDKKASVMSKHNIIDDEEKVEGKDKGSSTKKSITETLLMQGTTRKEVVQKTRPQLLHDGNRRPGLKNGIEYPHDHDKYLALRQKILEEIHNVKETDLEGKEKSPNKAGKEMEGGIDKNNQNRGANLVTLEDEDAAENRHINDKNGNDTRRKNERNLRRRSLEGNENINVHADTTTDDQVTSDEVSKEASYGGDFGSGYGPKNVALIGA